MPISPIQYRIKIAYYNPNMMPTKNIQSTLFHKDTPGHLLINIMILYLAIFGTMTYSNKASVQ